MSFSPQYKLLDWVDTDKLLWEFLAMNPNAISILEKNLNRLSEIGWGLLASNPNAIHILEKNSNIINGTYLSINPGAIPILQKHQDQIDWYYFSQNPNIITLDYEAMRRQCMAFCEELTQKVFRSSNMQRNLKKYNYDLNVDEYAF